MQYFKNKIDNLYSILDKFTKERDYLNLLLGNKKLPYNKSVLSYKHKNNV